MAFSPKAVAAIREKQKLGMLPKNPLNPQNVINQIPNLVPSSPIPSPVRNATMPAFKLHGPGVPGAQMPHAPGTTIAKPGANLPVQRFAGLRKRLGGI